MAFAYVVVPCGEVEVLRDVVVVILGEESHHVGSDELALVAMGADSLDLITLIVAPSVGDEAHPFEAQARIAASFRNRYLRPIEVGLAPVAGRPVCVEIVEGLVLRFEPVLKVRAGVVVIADVGVFVVDLPSGDVGVVSEALRHLFGDAARELPVAGRIPTELLAIAVFIADAVLVNAQRIGILLRKPRRRRGRGRSKHGDDVMARRCGDGVVEPVEIELAFARLHAAPGEFANAHHADVRLFHERKISFPARFGPLFGIPRCAE